MPIPHTAPADWSIHHPAPGRLARGIRVDSPDGCRVALLGLPDDTGIGLNNGRPGARHGPDAFRRALASYGCTVDAATGRELTRLGIYDAGDVQPAGDEIHRTHERVTDAVGAILDRGMIPVCIGGGHDLTFAGVRALFGRVPRLGGFNIDPHLDVRDRVGSGMPFRRIIEAGQGVVDPTAFAEVGLGVFSNASEHIEWARQRGVRLVFFDGGQHELLARFVSVVGELREEPHLFASFDLDVLDSSAAPGVSAINPMGLSTATASMICRTLGELPTLRYFDLMELSPPHDPEGRTARIAAHLFMSFLSGLAERWGE